MRRVIALMLLACACGGGSSRSAAATPAKRVVGHVDGGMVVKDSDSDGLCDSTELDIGTDPNNADSDHDGLPDLVELGNGFDPTNPNSPMADQLAHLEAKPGATLDFPVRATVDGDGQGVTGSFQAVTSIYADGTSAEDYYQGSVAIAVDPVDAVRNIDAPSAHFDSVLGPARLVFSLRFVYSDVRANPTCAKSYPFKYNIKSDDGSISADRLSLLIVEPEGQNGRDVPHCLPAGCQ